VTQCDVVIVNFNADGSLKDAVKTALQSRSVAHIYVVDNASIDTSLALIAQKPDDRLTLIRNRANLGFAAACNIGFAHSTSENVLLLNPDCQVVEGAVECMIEVLRSADHVGMVGPLLLNPDGSEQAGGRRKFPMPRLVIERVFSSTWLSRFIPLPGYLLHQEPLPKGPLEVEAISGACMMVRREAAAAVGPLDERYFLHCEDLDWCMRFHQQGWRIVFVPDAKVIHIKGVSSRHRPLAAEYYKHRGMVRFYRKFLGDIFPRWQMALVIAGIWVRFAAMAATHLMTKGARRRWSALRLAC
jgi:GT2 family glycosyltransferase